MVYPFYERLQNLSKNMTSGNFGLWYNKFIPIDSFESCKISDERGNDKNPISCYHEKYNKIQKDNIRKLLDRKHLDQAGFCDTLSAKYETVSLKAKLKSPLITGIGETHPHEVSMVFDHNMGIPYIPASGMKGIVRFAHTLGLLADIPPGKIQQDKDGKKYFDEEDDWTNVPQLFGTQKSRGSVIFLDAYPEKVPALHIDIMNPHYSDYYGGDTNTTPPADYLNPVPIKFLTVAKDTAFIFRVLVDKKSSELIEKVKAAFKNALTEEGIGAKTAVGYGLFDIDDKENKISGNTFSVPKPPKLEVKKAPDPEIWENANLYYAKNTGIVSAKWKGKNATTKDVSIISESLLGRLKKKSIPAKVKVELIGGKEYRLIEIHE